MSRNWQLTIFFSCMGTVVVSLIFVFFPVLDIALSRLFWQQDTGFSLASNPLVSFAARYNYLLALGYVLAALLLFFYQQRNWRQLLFLISSLVLGPGLLVNLVLKENWGRARPLAIEEFGGNASFSPAWILTDQCQTNCSFVSGHASTLFAFFAFALLVSARWRSFALLVVCSAGLLAGLGRIVEGKHFLSDVLLSGALVWLVAYLLYLLFFLRGKK